jgi:DNA-binding MarR family transcriptional regulator
MCQEDGYASAWEVVIAVRRFQHRLEVFMDQALEHLGMSLAQYRALHVLDANNEMHVSELARFLRLSRQAVQATVDTLHQHDLVELTHEPARVSVTPNDAGRHRLHLCRRFTHEFERQLEEDLTSGQRHRLVALVHRADRALRTPKIPDWWLAP